MRQWHALVLASGSPRRRAILEQLGVRFSVEPSGVPEDEPGVSEPQAVARVLAERKAEAVARAHADDPQAPYVLGADTLVVVGARILGKPRDDAEGREMLAALSGCTHEVVTGMSLCRAGVGVLDDLVVTTQVRFRTLDAEDARRYVESGEGRDKAGGYAIQGLGAGLVQAIDGSYTNVVGLPAVEVLGMLVQAGVLDRWP